MFRRVLLFCVLLATCKSMSVPDAKFIESVATLPVFNSDPLASFNQLLSNIEARDNCLTNCTARDFICRTSCYCESVKPQSILFASETTESVRKLKCTLTCICQYLEVVQDTKPDLLAFMRKFKDCLKCDDPLDLNKDGSQDEEDLIYILRAIDDPDGEPLSSEVETDLNGDGTVDLADATILLESLVEQLGEDALSPLSLSYDSEHDFNWDQASLSPATVRTENLFDPKAASLLVVDRQAQTCGISSSGAYSKGTGPDPTIVWDNGFAFNKSAKPDSRDFWNWAKYGVLLKGAKIALPDGAKAYEQYRSASGAELSVDYEKAIKDDSLIRAAVKEEIDAVKEAVKQLHDGEQASFSFHSKSARLVNSATENWQKALGGHRIWSVGTVDYDTSSCELSVEITIKVEDFYNFNKGQQDIASGLPDDDNGRFEVFGWAKSFFSRGSVTRLETIPLQCCNDSACGDETQFDCECNLCTTQCPTTQRSGGQGFTSFTVDLKKKQGTFNANYEMYSIPDELTILYEGKVVFGTGGLVSGRKTVAVNYGSNSSTSTFVTVEVNAPQSGTAWDVSVSCPP